MKKVILAVAIFAAGTICTTNVCAQTPSGQYVAPEVKKGGKPANYKVQEDKKAMNQIDNHARTTGNSMDATLKKANAVAAAKHEREQVAAARKKAQQKNNSR